jgi:hypothetical protein
LFKGRVREGFKKQQIDLLRQPLGVRLKRDWGEVNQS